MAHYCDDLKHKTILSNLYSANNGDLCTIPSRRNSTQSHAEYSLGSACVCVAKMRMNSIKIF